MTPKKQKQITLYTSPEGAIQVEVKIDQETIRLNQTQMSELFGVDRTVITKHIRNIVKEGELEEKSNVQKMHFAHSDKPIAFYNLDMIISVGYRVNSRQATHFRIRSTNVLKQYIMKGYSLNQLRITQTGLQDLTQSIAVIKRALETGELSYDESRGLVELMTTYIPSLITLHQYDTDMLAVRGKTNQELYRLEKTEAELILADLKEAMIKKNQASELFALPRDDGLDNIFGAIYQWFDGKDLYPSVEEKAAHLLYLIIKNHPFVDGNKRSSAFLFVWYLSRNNLLTDNKWIPKISEQTLVALALLVATSSPSEKELMVRLVITLIS